LILLTIDPGKHHFGYAIFADRQLRNCGTPTDVSVALDLAMYYRSRAKDFRLVMEKPQNYRSNKKTKSLDGLFWLCSELASKAGVDRFYLPREWKGQVPKLIHHNRLQRHLTPIELATWSNADHNARDAVGIGLFDLGRCRVGGL